MIDLQHFSQPDNIKPINRREFLYYLGGASVLLTLTSIAGLLIVSPRTTPRIPALGYFPVTANRLPEDDAPPS
ncbi:MAG: hypothetical protein U0670_19850 [Anaerolineae bacterium]